MCICQLQMRNLISKGVNLWPNCRSHIFCSDSTWSRLTIEEDDKISCEVLEHTYCISTKYFGSLAASLEGESVLGKRMRCAAFCKFEENSENLDVIVYIFNNHVSEFMWKVSVSWFWSSFIANTVLDWVMDHYCIRNVNFVLITHEQLCYACVFCCHDSWA